MTSAEQLQITFEAKDVIFKGVFYHKYNCIIAQVSNSETREHSL